MESFLIYKNLILLFEHIKMVPKNNGEFYQRYRSSQKITPNSELLVSTF
ncbi:hypothetical protein LEP1GSC074_1400 [Leptospira noguchii str. Hook]|nr:hypothetical protein LEP1GSC074_1400 [Leptospira noguchii str. Hook]